jgi:hypothetical protein
MVIAKLPNAGLGNKMFVWARALIYSKQKNCSLQIYGLNRIHIGPFLRKEKVKRFYLGQFKFSLNLPELLKFSAKHLFSLIHYHEPSFAIINQSQEGLFIFSKIPPWSDYFQVVRDHRELIKKEFPKLLSKRVSNKLKKIPAPVIACHIRCGDFGILQENEVFKNVGGVRTPLEYFVNTIKILRSIAGHNLPVTVFSDGNEVELSSVLALEKVSFFSPQEDVVDLVVMSKAEYIITSASSTFSEWAAFLSSAVIILHPDHIHTRIRKEDNLFEGSIEAFRKYKEQAINKQYQT